MTVGSHVVQNLLKHKDIEVHVLTSSEEKIKNLPEGVKGIVGNLDKKETLPNAFKGMDEVFLLTPLSQTETQEGLNAVEAAKNAGVKKIVYMSVHKLEDIKEAPHFAGKIPIEDAIKKSGMEYTLLRPNNFFQNDVWFKQPITEYNVYPQPIGNTGLNRVDVRDIADAAENALLKNDFIGKTYSLVGPDKLTADEAAEIYSKYLDKKIHYGGNDLEKWSQQAKQMLPDWLIDDFKIMYKHFQEKGFTASEQDLTQTKEIIGKEPRNYDNFVREITSSWKNN